MSDSASAVAALDGARDRFLDALATVPDDALGFLKPGDDYSLGGLLLHVNGALRRYAEVLTATRTAGGETVDATAIDAGMHEANARSREGLDGEARRREEATLRELHARVVDTMAGIAPEDWETKTPVVYGGSPEPYPTGPGDIAGWLTDHYEEHVPQVAELLEAWRSAAPA
jgi:hypothetical protein